MLKIMFLLNACGVVALQFLINGYAPNQGDA